MKATISHKNNTRFRHQNFCFPWSLGMVCLLLLSGFTEYPTVKDKNPGPSPKITSTYECLPPAAALATIQPTKSGRWDDTSVWPNGQLPTMQDDVVVPQGTNLVLVGGCNAKSITVNGTLRALNNQPEGTQFDLRTRYIMVMGNSALMQIGTEKQHYQSVDGGTITLVGNDPKEMIPGTEINSKALMVMNGARLELHGKPKVSWVKIGAKAGEGSKTLTLAEAVDWEVGDQIVITSNRYDPFEAEERTITSISNNKRKITFATGLKFPRNGELKTYSNGKSTWNMDTRAEVGLLSRNLTIQGDNSSVNNEYGGHIMIMNNASGKADNIELTRMGQRYILARYPWHWHMMGESSTGQYIKNSSIHHTYNRAITIHGSWGTLVDNNVAYDHIGHGIFLEDGSEINNIISNNLALLTRMARKANGEPDLDNALLDTDAGPAYAFQSSGPATFWITNPNNTFVNNVVAGSEGTAYWFIYPQKPTGLSAKDIRFKDMKPVSTNLKKFDGNIAHSCITGLDVNDNLDENHRFFHNKTPKVKTKNGAWKNTEVAVMNDLTFFSNYFGLYSGIGDVKENVIFNNVMSADMVLHVNFATNHRVQNSIFIADTDNGLTDKHPFHTKINSPTNPGDNLYLYRMYDGPGRVYDSHFVNWNRNYTSVFKNNGAASKRINHLFKGITYNHDGPARINDNPNFVPETTDSKRCPQNWSNVIRDLDGSLSRTGKPNSVVTDYPFNRIGVMYQPDNWNGMISTEERYIYAELPNQNMTVVTKDSQCDAIRVYNAVPCNLRGSQQLHLPVDGDKYVHSIYFSSLDNNSMNFTIQNSLEAGDGVMVRFKGFGALQGVSVENSAKVNSVNKVRTATANSYFVQQDGDLVVKFVTTNKFGKVSHKISWNSGNLPANMAPESPKEPPAGCVETLSVEDLDEQAIIEKIMLYPVPATNRINLSLPEQSGAVIAIYNQLGQRLYEEQTNSHTHSISLRGMESGMYFMNIRIGKEILRKSFVKE